MSDVIDYKIHGNDMQIVEVELDPGEGVRAEAGAMMFMESGIEMETAASGGMMGGFKNALFGGEGLFLATLTGPGKVYLQGLPLSRLADRITSASGGGADKGEEGVGPLAPALANTGDGGLAKNRRVELVK